VALAARRQIQYSSSPWLGPYLPGLLLFELLVVLPVSGYLFFSHTAWSMLYLVETDDLSIWWGPAFLLGILVVGVAGYWIGDRLCRRRRERLLVVFLILVAMGFLSICLLAGDRLGRLADDGKWSDSELLMETTLGTTIAFVIPVALGGLVFLLVLFSIEGRKMSRSRVDNARIDYNSGSFSQPNKSHRSADGYEGAQW
jgi:hypothetical protein